MPRIYNLCARVQNGFRARLQSIAIPDTKDELGRLGDHVAPDATYTPTTPANIATRRLWLTLKYKDNKPALNSLSVISKPSKKVTFTVNE
ncbi:unnamed protein product [Umbelopsis vinacea]